MLTSVRPETPIEQRIIAADGLSAEVIFALGRGSDVIATDISATYPPEADALPSIGYQRALSSEPLINLDPTLVVASSNVGPPETLDELRRVGIPVAVVPVLRNPEGPGTIIRDIGEAISASAEAFELAANVDAAIDVATRRGQALKTAPRVIVLYIRGEGLALTFGAGSAVDWVVTAAGGVNVGAELGIDNTAPLNAESVIRGAPDVIVVPERGLDSVGGVDGLLKLGGLSATPAGKHRQVLAYDDQYLLGNGPRTGALIDQMVNDFTHLTITPAQP